MNFPSRILVGRGNKTIPNPAILFADKDAETFEGYSGADIRRICEKASDIPFVESIKTGQARDIEMRDLLTAQHDVKQSVTRQMMDRFEKFSAQGTP